MAGAEGWRGVVAGEKAGAKSKQTKPFTKTCDILGGGDMIWLRFYHNPSGCSVKYRPSLHPRRRGKARRPVRTQWQYFT